MLLCLLLTSASKKSPQSELKKRKWKNGSFKKDKREIADTISSWKGGKLKMRQLLSDIWNNSADFKYYINS